MKISVHVYQAKNILLALLANTDHFSSFAN